ncbi:MAG: glycosyltransferase family 2 protein [Thermoanaerobaculales bacterium]|nr:glycosyltransferase family 2 protein [Thermoanaerobaculales bacterium]
MTTISNLRLSLCVITLNEEANLKRCLRSVKGLADEIVVVDSMSTDRTRDIAASAGARVVEQEFLGHVKQKQLALDLATGDWVLSLDADEWLDQDLRSSIAAALSEGAPEDVAGFELNRQVFYLGRWIHHSGWAPEWKLRLVRRVRAKWTGYDPHDRLEVEGRTARLDGRLRHHPHDDLADHLSTINRYTDIIVSHWPQTSRFRMMLGLFVEPPLVFFQKYLLQGGFRDGIRGLIISVMTAFYFFLRHAKLWERDHPPAEPLDS